MKLRPLLDKVVLKKVEALETTKAGIILPDSAKEKPEVSEIVAVGPGGIVDGNKVEMTVKVGDQELGYTDDLLPREYYAGIIACEGVNRFYEFEIDK